MEGPTLDVDIFNSHNAPTTGHMKDPTRICAYISGIHAQSLYMHARIT